jgi:hypothetical protein
MRANEFITEKWTKKYKKSINCSNPKGFSQKAHCAGRKARQSGKKTKSSSVNESYEVGTLLDLTPNFQNYEKLYGIVVGHRKGTDIVHIRPIIADVKRGLKPNAQVIQAAQDINGFFPLKSQFIKKVKVLDKDSLGEETIKLRGFGSSDKSKEFVAKVNSMYPQSPLNPAYRVIIYGEGDDMQIVQFELVPKEKNKVEVKWIQATPMRSGAGSKAMKELQDLAREDNIALTLYPWDKGQVSQSNLIKFYKKHGFNPLNKSKNMIWEPK